MDHNIIQNNIQNIIIKLDSNDKDSLKKTYFKLKKQHPDFINNIKLYFYYYHDHFEVKYYQWSIYY
jgi:hypothetical protein